IHRILSGEGLTGANAMDMMVRLPDGRELEFSVSGAPLRGTKGNITGGVVITRDVTERRRLERMAQGFAREAVARASQLEATIEAMADGVFIYDAEGHIAGGVLIMRDVTERRHVEQRTHDSLDALLAIAEDLVWIPSEASSAEDPLPDTLTAMSIVARRLADLTCSVLGCRRVSI